jgi:hypothetical protein
MVQSTAAPQITPGGMDAGFEPPWMGLRRVFGGDTQSMSLIFVEQQWLEQRFLLVLRQYNVDGVLMESVVF